LVVLLCCGDSWYCCCVVLTVSTAVVSFWQLVLLLCRADSWSCCCVVLTVGSVVVSCWQFVLLLYRADSWYCCCVMLTVGTAVVSCWQLVLLLCRADSWYCCCAVLTVRTAVVSCWQLVLLLCLADSWYCCCVVLKVGTQRAETRCQLHAPRWHIFILNTLCLCVPHSYIAVDQSVTLNSAVTWCSTNIVGLFLLCLMWSFWFSEYNEQDGTFSNLFIYFSNTLYIFQTCFPSIIRSTKPAAGSNNGLTNICRSTCSFELPDDGWNPRLKHVERLTEINKLWNIASCWLYSVNILATHWSLNFKLVIFYWFYEPYIKDLIST